MAPVAAKQVEAVAVTKPILAFLLLATCNLFAQEKKKDLPPPELHIIYSYYMQDGNNSAVTGGTGTEELHYHGPAVVVHIPTDSLATLSINAGVDVLVFGNNLEYDEAIPTRAIEVITKMVEKGIISKERIQQSYDRIMRAKRQIGLN